MTKRSVTDSLPDTRRNAKRSVILIAVSCITFGLFIAPHVSAQEKLFDWFGQQSSAAAGDLFGGFVSTGADVDLDGRQDIIVTAILEEPIGVWAEVGSIYLFSGSTGTLLRKQSGGESKALFGTRPVAGSDYDGDGISDYVVSAPEGDGAGTDEGVVYAYSGADGKLIYAVLGEHQGSGFGWTLARLEDVDADGVEDIGISAPRFGGGTTGHPSWCGRVYLVSGATGAVLQTYTGVLANERMGTVCRLGDMTGDGAVEFGIGSWVATSTGHGQFTVFDGRAATVLYSLPGESANDLFGYSAVGMGDADADGLDEFLISAPAFSSVLGSEGRVYCYSGASATAMYIFDGSLKDERLGEVLPSNGRGDLNGDGYADILLGSPNTRFGKIGGVVDAYSGRTGRLLHQFRGQVFSVGERLGVSVSWLGDVNVDGVDDIAIGAPQNETNFTGGHAYVYAGNDFFLQAGSTQYSPGDTVRLDMRGGEPKSLALLALVEINSNPMFVPILVGALNSSGNLRFTDVVPPGISGTEMSFMGYSVKASGRGLIDTIKETIEFK